MTEPHPEDQAPPTLAVLGEHGPEAVIPLRRPRVPRSRAAVRVRLLVAAGVIVRRLPIGVDRRNALHRRLAGRAYRLALADFLAQLSRKAGRG